MPYIEHIYYEEAGAGQPVIFIHCPALSHVYWRPIMERLQSLCRCIAIDVRGHGKSGRGDQPWDFRDIAEDITKLTRGLGLEKPVLVGYSSGSSIAILAVLEEPGLYGGVVMVSGFSECCTVTMRIKVNIGLLALDLGLVPLIGPNIIGSNSVGKWHTQAMLPDARSVNPRSLRSFFLSTIRTSFTDRLHEVKVPVLLVNGDQDDWMHGYYRTLHAKLPNVRAIFFPQTDHRVPTRHPEDFADCVAQFLAQIGHARSPADPVVIDAPYLEPGPQAHQLHP